METVSSNIFDLHCLLSRANWYEIVEFPQYDIVKSKVTSDPWHNYVFLKTTNPDSILLQSITEMIDVENSKGLRLSLYIHSSLLTSYQDLFTEFGVSRMGIDEYLYVNQDDNTKIILPPGYELTSVYDIESVKNVLVECFEGWEGENQYTDVFESLKQREFDDREYETFVVMHESQVVAAGSVAIDQQVRLAYLHNTGVVKQHRRKGLYTALLNQRLNLMRDRGVTRALAISETNSGSYKALLKNGFRVEETAYLYAVR
jgi:predicted acetyltransferase